MSAIRTSFALLAMGLCVAACGALQGLDKFDKCDTDEECGLLEGGGTDSPVSTDGPSSGDTSTGEAGCGDVLSDPKNCGRCGNPCATGFTCSGGTCSCTKTTCGGPRDGGADAGDASADGGGELRCVDLSIDVLNCGLCDNACAIPNAVPKCVLGHCGLGSCTAGFVDCDGNAANGCECASDSCDVAKKLCSKRAFVTSTTFAGGALGGLTGADAKCQARAVAAGLPGTYKAWLSDSTGSPSTRFAKAPVPYRLVDGTIIANNFSDIIDGTLSAPLVMTELGTPAPRSTICGPQPNTNPVINDRIWVWTSTAADGTLASGASTCTNWSDPAVGGAQWADPATSGLLSNCGGGACNGGPYLNPLFCFQQ